MRVAHVVCAVGLLAAAASGPVWARVVHAKGAEPVDPSLYAKFPTVQRHRAWLQPSVDLTSRFPLPGDQAIQSSCVAWAAGYGARSFLNSEELGRAPSKAEELVSPAYIFYRIRDKKDNCVRSGSNLAAALDLLKNEGAVSLADLPYGAKTCLTAPTEQQIASAARWKIGGWRAIQRETPGDWRTPIVLDDVKAQLQQNLPVVFTMGVPANFDDFLGSEVYSSDQPATGMHAMALVGYDESRQAFRLINSWGRTWGDGGYAWLAYDTFARLVIEAYVLEPPQELISHAPAQPAIVLDPVKAAVNGIGCGKVSVKTTPDGKVVEGFAGDQASYDHARDEALAADPKLKWNVAFRRWPQCEAEITLERPLTDRAAHIEVHREDGSPLSGDPVALKADDIFSVEATTTPERPYLDVIYLQADGSAVEIYQGKPEAGADGRLRIALGAAGRKADRFQVGPPYGDEVLILLASDKPLFGSELSSYRTERQFLTVLRARLTEAAKQGQAVSADIARIRTAG